MFTVYACEPFPDKVERTLYLAGPKCTNVSKSWRLSVLSELQALQFKGHVFLPEPRTAMNPEYGSCDSFSDSNSRMSSSGYSDINPSELIKWEQQCMTACDILLFWFDRYESSLCLELNDDFGMYKNTGRVIVAGFPERACRVGYQKKWCLQHDIPIFKTLRLCVVKCMAIFASFENRFGLVERTGATTRIPNFVYAWNPFSHWYEKLILNKNTLITCVLNNCVTGMCKNTNARKVVKADITVCIRFNMGPNIDIRQNIHFESPEFYIFGYYMPNKTFRRGVSKQKSPNCQDVRIVLKYHFQCSMNASIGMDPAVQLIHGSLNEDSPSYNAKEQVPSVELISMTWRESTGQIICDSTRFESVKVGGNYMQSDVKISARMCFLYMINLTEKEHAEIESNGGEVGRHIIVHDYSSLQYHQMDWKTIGMIELAMRNIEITNTGCYFKDEKGECNGTTSGSGTSDTESDNVDSTSVESTESIKSI